MVYESITTIPFLLSVMLINLCKMLMQKRDYWFRIGGGGSCMGVPYFASLNVATLDNGWPHFKHVFT